jgi:hypothetical protein
MEPTIEVTDELLVYLEGIIPEPRLTPDDSMESIQYALGRRSVVNELRQINHENHYGEPPLLNYIGN